MMALPSRLGASMAYRTAVIAIALLLAGCGGGGGGGAPATAPAPAPTPPPSSTDDDDDDGVDGFVAVDAGVSGLVRGWGYEELTSGPTTGTFPLEFSSGLAAADYDDDGDIDLYVVGGDEEPNHLFENQGDGTFRDVAGQTGLDLRHLGSGPAFADIDGDGDLDLFVGAVEGERYYLMENTGGTFTNITVQSNIVLTAANTVSATFADYDLDGDLDLFLAHWGFPEQADTETVWQNGGDGIFESASIESGIAAELVVESLNYNNGEVARIDRTFTANLTDLDADGDPDLLMAADYDTSQVFRNNGDGTFTRTTDREVIVDQSGMGASVGDYDNDGDMDWFVTSIYENPDFFGNRLYRNDGTGAFTDETDTAKVGNGGWGWASCFADFDNDGHLDLVNVNGWRGDTSPGNGFNFLQDQIRFFHNQGDGTFVERAQSLGLVDRGQGRALACFDAERDGDIDLVLTNNDDDPLIYYRNELDAAQENHWLGIRLESDGPNRHGVGAWITLTTTSGTQVRELRAGNNFASHNPLEVHFGLGADTRADIVVRWPDGSETSRAGVAVDRMLVLSD